MPPIRALIAGAIAMLAVAGPVAAQPASYRVINVDSTDVLNVRRTPSPTSAIIAGLASDIVRVEVLETRHGWGRVMLDSGEGWVSMAYLAPAERASLPGLSAPGGFRCSGVEPFWGLDLAHDGTGQFNDAMSMGAERRFDIVDARTAHRRAHPLIYRFEGEAAGFAVIEPQTCSDGMSPRSYGWHVVADVEDGEGRRLLEGCCWSPPQK